MPLRKIKVYEIEISGHLTIEGPDDTRVLKAAKGRVEENVDILMFALTEHDGFEWIEPPPPP